MCRLLGYCARGETALADLIGGDGLSQFIALSELHGDGWGMAWYEGSEPVVRKSPLRADEPAFEKLAVSPSGSSVSCTCGGQLPAWRSTTATPTRSATGQLCSRT